MWKEGNIKLQAPLALLSLLLEGGEKNREALIKVQLRLPKRLRSSFKLQSISPPKQLTTTEIGLLYNDTEVQWKETHVSDFKKSLGKPKETEETKRHRRKF